ncbi:MAG TPA: class I fructose-bisphosphate aldolase, partial [Candidatus Nanoarchaeia archaeon]|nr:class I fructose-bisphosphate aldolase [Candidatus Nanoarchaeia archaeon]
MLVTASGLGKFISGAILYEETLLQKSNGFTFVDVLKKQGIIPGIKVDKGTKELALFPGETVTEGLDELRERLKKYAVLGAQFAKWRATFSISEKTPSLAAMHANAHAMARYAALCQEQQIVPIVEPEVLMEGKHTIEQSYSVTRKVHHLLFEELEKHNVAIEHVILKTNMVLAGYNGKKAAHEDVAEMTVKCLLHLPVALGGVVFLSGGQSDDDATKHLNFINRMYKNKVPWRMTFSYG